MDPDDRQRQRDARRRARQGDGEGGDGEYAGQDDNDNSRQQQEDEDRKNQYEKEEEDTRRDKEKRENDRKRRQEEQEKEREEDRQRKEEETKRQNEAGKKNKKTDKKRKGLGGLSLEKKRLLKTLIMQKAAEEMKAEMKKKQEEKENHLRKLVPELNTDTDSTDKMIEIVKKLYERVCKLEGEKYDWELQLRNVDFEINELTLKVNNVKGKFVKPVLKRVSKSEGMWSKLEKKEQKSQIGFREQLKSTGQNKFALDDKEENHPQKNTDWREHLKPKDSENNEDAVEIEVSES